MKIYLLEKADNLGNSPDVLQKYGEVVLLNTGEKDIQKYKQLFTDKSEKVIGIAPGIIEWKFSTAAIAQIKNLKGICTKSSWAHYLDLKYCKEHEIIICNTPGANSQSVAEYAIWQMLCLLRQFPIQQQDNLVAKHDAAHLQTEIFGKTMGVVGLGNVGNRIAKLGQCLGMNVIYWNRSKKNSAFKSTSLEYILKTADCVFNCLEVSDETSGFFDKKKINLLKKSAYFVSVMGGGGWKIEDTDYLINLVETGKLAGYSVENEHASDYHLPKNIKGNVFIPAAYAWYTKEARVRSIAKWNESIIGIVMGKPKNIVKF